MTELDHKTLDIGAVIAGIGFPETDVEVFFDERPGFAVAQAKKELIAAEVRGDTERVAELDKGLAEVREAARASRYVVSLKGLPESTRKVCDAEAREAFPNTYNLIGQPEPNPEKNDKYEELLWLHSIVKLTDPNGAVGVPSAEQVKAIRDGVGRSAGNAINEGIRDLIEGAKEGFEDAVRNPDFLSDASPEG